MVTNKIPIAVVKLAAGYKASREGKDRNIATREMLDTLSAMGFEIDHSEKRVDPLATIQPFEPLSVT